MGLTLNFKLAALPGTPETGAATLVARMHAIALSQKQAGKIQAVGRIASSPEELFWDNDWLFVRERGSIPTTRGIEVPPVSGRVFPVFLGEGCEALRLGLCRYPSRVEDPVTGKSRRVRNGGWRLSGCCKTQYASLQGWEHFKACHIAAVDLLESFSRLGLKVDINDEGGFWPGRDEAALRQNLDRMNGIVAALAGAAKDAAEEDGVGPVHSPIFSHPQFERIEAEGLARERGKIRGAVRVIRTPSS